MLKRAASNAYSWWRASHIRAKQSKWLDNNLEEMEDTVKKMLKLIEPDADSFAKRAELYFKRRPELISFVEEIYKAYRALTERYDHISGELHKANHIIATSFPEGVQYAMLEDDDSLPKAITPINPSKINRGTVEGVMNKKKESESSKKKGKKKKGKKAPMDKEQAQEEINKLQKRMLALQTEKEFVKSSYESGIAKYWEIEKRYMEMHEKARCLEEEFNISVAIEDNEARALMAETAIKSCEKTIVKLQEQRKKALEQEKLESDRTKALKEKLEALKGGSCQIEMENPDGDAEMSFTTENMEEEFYSLNKTRTALQFVREKIKGYFEENPENSVMEMAEKIEELANKVVTMELTDSSRATQINSLNSRNDELEKYIRSLEEDEVTLSNNSNELNERLKEAEGELSRVQAIKKTIQDEEKVFRENFSDTWQSLNGISQMLQPDTSLSNACIGEVSPEREIPTSDTDLQGESIDKEVTEIHDIKEIASAEDDPEKEVTSVEKESSESDLSFHLISNEETILDEKEATLKLQQLIQSGLEGKEKILLAGFTSILQNYTETKMKLSEAEKKYDDYLEETRALIEELEELKTDIAVRDAEIRLLRRPMRQLTKSAKRSSMDTLEGPPVEAPPVEVLPVEAPSVEVLPVEVPPEAPPVEIPPAEAPPVEIPPAEAFPAEAPPAEIPPAEAPPAEALPAEAPVAEALPAEAPPLEIPPAEAPPVEIPPAEAPPVDIPPAEAPPVEIPPAEAPPVEASSAEAPPTEISPVEAPPVEVPPVEAPPAEAPPVEVPPVEAPPVEASPVKSKPFKKKLERKSNSAMETWTSHDSAILAKLNIKAAAKKDLSGKLKVSETPENLDIGSAAKKSGKLKVSETPENLDIESAAKKNSSGKLKDSETPENLDIESSVKKDSSGKLKDSETPENLDIESAAEKDSSGKLQVKRKALAERFPKKITPFEQKFRKEIDRLIDDKLEFWLKFCTSFCQIQEFKARYEDLEADIKAKDNKSPQCTDNVTCDQAGKPESSELTTSLRELKTELRVWLEQGALLKEDLQNRFSSLCDMQEEILSVLSEDPESGEILISPYKAERLQGEVINMKLENSKVAGELQVGLDQVKGFHDEIEQHLHNLCQNFGPFVLKNLPSDYLENPNKANVPLRDFLFGVKPKKTSILGRIQHGKLKAARRKNDF